MKKLSLRKALTSIGLSMLMLIVSISMVSAQNPAYQTTYVTSITYQNLGTGAAQVQFDFFAESTASKATTGDVIRSVGAGSGSSLFVGGLTGGEALPAGFLGSGVMSSNQPVVATLVQIPNNSTTVRNRPLSNGFSSATSSVLLATVLKNTFNTNSRFVIQNADSTAINITVKIFNADNPSAPSVDIVTNNVPQGAAKYYDMGNSTQVPISAASFNGSATVSAVKATDGTPANIVGSVLELSTNGPAVKAFEGVTGDAGANTIYMATALCDVFSPQQRTAYAVQNTSTTASANVTVNYSGAAGSFSETATIAPGAKKSFNACTAPGKISNFTGAATIVSTGAEIVVIGKAFIQGPNPNQLQNPAGFETAFLGESAGAAKLALPYVRFTSDANFQCPANPSSTQCRQRTNIAIQNIGTAAVSNVQVKYLNKNGEVVGTHTIPSIAAGAKANSKSTDAGTTDALVEFGTPTANPGGGFGGAVVIEAPAGSQLIAIGRVSSAVGSSLVAEDYNAIPVQ